MIKRLSQNLLRLRNEELKPLITNAGSIRELAKQHGMHYTALERLLQDRSLIIFARNVERKNFNANINQVIDFCIKNDIQQLSENEVEKISTGTGISKEMLLSWSDSKPLNVKFKELMEKNAPNNSSDIHKKISRLRHT